MTFASKNSMLCPGCRRLISQAEGHCPYCGMKNPSGWFQRRMFTATFRDPDQLIKNIIIVNVVMYLVTILFSPRGAGMGWQPTNLLSPDNRSLFLLGATGTIPINQMHRWWSLLTANYLHGSLLHIFFNMMALRQIGPLVAQEYGLHLTFLLYTLGGCLGFLVSYLAGVTFTIGASAAVCSLIGSLLFFGKSRGGSYGREVYAQVGSWAMGIFFFGLLAPGINNWGHGGGMAAGVILGYWLGYQERSREQAWHRALALGCALATAALLGWTLLSGLLFVLGGRV